MGRPEQRRRALALHHVAGVPLVACGLEEVEAFQRVVLPQVQLVVVSPDHFDSIVFKGPEAPLTLYLLFHDGHFDVVTSMAAFCGTVYYCLKCEKGYNTENYRTHKCGLKCLACHALGCGDLDKTNAWVRCGDCLRMMRGPLCMTNHRRVASKSGRSVCQSFRKCQKCERIVKTERVHRCGEVKCLTCDKYKPEDHLCFMAKPRKKKKEGEEKKEKNFLFFDFECIQETGQHVPNLVVVQNAAGREWLFSGPNTCRDFCDWLFGGENDGAVCVAHNFKGYDSYFILKYLYDNKVLPKLVMNGAKVMEIKVTQCDIRLIDSLNFLPMPLSQFPKTFGLTELAKGYFPHFFNTTSHQDYHGTIPEVDYYDPDGMKPKAREAFMSWHAEQVRRGAVFDFQQELVKYCRSDVDILRRCCVSFSNTVRGLCGMNPFEHCITIASLCNLIFRTMFLKEDTIGIIPQLGYRKKAQQSVVAYRWLAYMSWKEGVYIQHGRNAGEKRVGPYLLDGWCEATSTAYEFHGCFFHGCPKCYPGKTENKVSGVTMHELYVRTCTKKEYLVARGLFVVEVWECEFAERMRLDPELAAFVGSLEDLVDPLNPRDAFTGGRTNASRLLVKTKGTPLKIKYIDFTSLYPDINKNGVYPVGHPTILTDNLNGVDVSQYFGLVQCDVLPPRGLLHPVLPYRCHKKLMFVLCRTCAETEQQTPCCHDDARRKLRGTWVSLELDLAVAKGYRVLKVHEVWHFENKSSDLFRGYINMFLKKKQEASGWPAWCTSEVEKRRYLQEYKEAEGIELDYDAIQVNPGARTVWKQILNNFWGKLGQRPNRPKVKVISEAKEYFEHLLCGGVEVTNAHLVNDQVVELFYKMKESFVEPSDRTNVVLAAFTTAQARIKLYQVLHDLGTRVCYYDTDSVIYTTCAEDWDPPLGDFLGQFTSELDEDDWIETFVAAGPKNYAYRTQAGKTCCKVRGITLGFRAAQQVNLDSMVEMVEGGGGNKEGILVHNPHKIVRNVAERIIETRPEDKLYKIVYNKRVIQPDFSTLPYGF